MIDDPAPITHRPLGSGHPYRIDPDQRHPVQPVVGLALELRVVADPAVEAVTLELTSGRGGVVDTPMALAAVDDLYPPDLAGDGHLAAASGARPEIGADLIWHATVGTPNESFRYRFTSGAFSTRWFAVEPGRWQRDDGSVLTVRGDADRLVMDATEVLMTDSGPTRIRGALALAAGERAVGFGERFDRLDQRGAVLDATVFEQYKRQGNRTYLPSPFALVIGESPWAFHIETSRRVWFDVGVGATDRLAFETTLDPADPHLVVRTDVGSPAAIVGRHVERIGRPVRPPDWVFLPWMSGNEWNTQARVLAEVERSIELDIPVGAIVIEAWSDESTFVAFHDAEYQLHPDGAPHRLADFDFPATGRWPDPAGMVERLHSLGVKVLLWQIPLIPTDRGEGGQAAADARTLSERGWCVGEQDGSPYRNRGWWFTGAVLPDWTNPDAVDWWLAKRRYLVEEVGVDGFKTDGGEHAWGDELRYHDGTRGVVANNLNPNRYAAAYHRLLADCGVDGVTFSRAGFTGAGSTPCHWAGDEDSTWEAFRASVIAGLTAGIVGVPFWGWDLAGFSGEIPSVELFARATAMAAFCPIMQYHSEFNHGRSPNRDRTPWNLAERHGDHAPIEIYRSYAQLRRRLLPYLSASADWTATTGVPMMRPSWFDDPGDETAWQAEYGYQYLFGQGLLVAPVCWESTQEMAVHLPAGTWIDPATGDRHAGGREITVATPLDRIPVFVRDDHTALVDVVAP